MEQTPANSNIIDLVDSPPPQQKSCIPVLQLSQRLKNAQLDAANSRGKPKIMIEKFGNYENKVKRNPSAIGNYENDVKRNPSANNKRKYVDESDPETPSESNDTEDDGDILVTSKLPPPGQTLVHPKTGAVYENVTHKVYKRAMEGDLDWEGYTIQGLSTEHISMKTKILLSMLVETRMFSATRTRQILANLLG